MLDIQFQSQSLSIKLVDEEGQNYFLNFPKLCEKIEPEKSSFRLRNNKIIITMHKWLETKWKDLVRASASDKWMGRNLQKKREIMN